MWRRVLVVVAVAALGPLFRGAAPAADPEYQGCAKFVYGSSCGYPSACFCYTMLGTCSSQQKIPRWTYTSHDACQQGQTNCFEIWTLETKCYMRLACRIDDDGEDCNVSGCETYGDETAVGSDLTAYLPGRSVACEWEPRGL